MKQHFVMMAILCAAGFSAMADIGGSFVKTTKSYRLEDINQVDSLNVYKNEQSAWRGERINWQILLWASENPVLVQVAASDLVAPDGHIIQSEQVSLDFLKFIHMNTRDGYAQSPEHVELVPDMLNGPAPVTIKAGELQPLWVGIDIPRQAVPGVYQGGITVTSGGRVL